MQSFFSTWAVSVTIAILFSTIINSLLPETSIKKYVSIVLGIVVTIIILSPLFTLFSGNNWRSEIEDALGEVQDTGSYEFDGALYKDYVQEVYMRE